MRYAYPQFEGKLAEVAFVGLEIPDVQLLRDERRVARIRVVSAYGFPSRVRLESLKDIPNYESQKDRVELVLTGDRPRSMREAFEKLLETSFVAR